METILIAFRIGKHSAGPTIAPVRLAASLVALSLLALAAPAHAETWSSRDRRADVIGYEISLPDPSESDDGVCDTPPPRRVRSDARRDLLRLSVDHTATDVVVTLSVRAVAHRDRDTSYDVYLRTPGATYGLDAFRTEEGTTYVTLSEQPPPPEPTVVDGCEVVAIATLSSGCEGLSFERDPAADTVTYTVPRRCIDRPRWVEVGAEVYGFPGDSEGRSDRWGRRGLEAEGYLPPFGPRVRAS